MLVQVPDLSPSPGITNLVCTVESVIVVRVWVCAGCRAYACQCRWYTATEFTELTQTDVKWVCGKHWRPCTDWIVSCVNISVHTHRPQLPQHRGWYETDWCICLLQEKEECVYVCVRERSNSCSDVTVVLWSCGWEVARCDFLLPRNYSVGRPRMSWDCQWWRVKIFGLTSLTPSVAYKLVWVGIVWVCTRIFVWLRGQIRTSEWRYDEAVRSCEVRFSKFCCLAT